MLINSYDIKINSHFGAIIWQTEMNKNQFILTRYYYIALIKGSYMIKFHNNIPQEKKKSNKLIYRP